MPKSKQSIVKPDEVFRSTVTVPVEFNVYQKEVSTGKVKNLKCVRIDKLITDPEQLAYALQAECHIMNSILEAHFQGEGERKLMWKNINTELVAHRIPFLAANFMVSSRRIFDMFISAFENGSGYWVNSVEYCGELPLASGLIWYDCPELLMHGPLFEITYDTEDKGEGYGLGRKVIGMEQVQKGIELMARHAPQHFADMVTEKDDMFTADVFLQYVVIGDYVYS